MGVAARPNQFVKRRINASAQSTSPAKPRRSQRPATATTTGSSSDRPATDNWRARTTQNQKPFLIQQPGQILQNLFYSNTIAVKLLQDFDAWFELLSEFQVDKFAPASKDKVIIILRGQICRCQLILCLKSCVKMLQWFYGNCITAKYVL